MDKDKNKDSINMNELPKNNDQVVDIDMSVGDFTPDGCRYESVDDLTEKAILNLERTMIRSSYEYKNYINYLKNELDLTTCELMPGIDTKTDPVSLEFHHYPFTLFDITQTVARELIQNGNGDPVSGFDIAEQVMKEHYENNIGLIPLTTTLHSMAHSGAIQIPLKYINGNFNNFYNKYKEFMTPELIEKYQDNLVSSTSENIKENNDEKLAKKILFFNIDYSDANNSEDEDDLEDLNF